MNTEKKFIFEEKQILKNKSTQDIRFENDSAGLTAIAKFGWLRAREIGNVLWPKNQTRHTAGARVTRRWIKEKLVLERQLPRGFGTAFVLSKKGADFVNFETEYAQKMDPVESGKKIGDHIEQVDGSWIPTRSWRHDLLANGFLTLAMGKGAEVFSELEMRRIGERGHTNKFQTEFIKQKTLTNGQRLRLKEVVSGQPKPGHWLEKLLMQVLAESLCWG
jgi:hypothetical protein